MEGPLYAPSFRADARPYRADGMIRAYDILSGRLVRIFNERSAPRQALRHILAGQADADEEAKWSVSNIIASREGFVASIGARILAWRAGGDAKAHKKTPRSGGRLSSRAERYRTEMELKQDIRESTAVLDNEHQDRMTRLSEFRIAESFAGIPKSLGDMTDEEAVSSPFPTVVDVTGTNERSASLLWR